MASPRATCAKSNAASSSSREVKGRLRRAFCAGLNRMYLQPVNHAQFRELDVHTKLPRGIQLSDRARSYNRDWRVREQPAQRGRTRRPSSSLALATCLTCASPPESTRFNFQIATSRARRRPRVSCSVRSNRACSYVPDWRVPEQRAQGFPTPRRRGPASCRLAAPHAHSNGRRHERHQPSKLHRPRPPSSQHRHPRPNRSFGDPPHPPCRPRANRR
ncbi:hypothetical protein EXIGLDRAFT_506053 [Exidia glandulosa HHB12029]|uniref:Uncharacterized protein n=1 Tax=Exidia glandulosa HHB12029 TaxID=1314781 RepID=A0A165JBF9_EXIGL|nr:hypothetical protein EXIGLDRAFT_506053 [Exidia glandulosa HHB12029]